MKAPIGWLQVTVGLGGFAWTAILLPGTGFLWWIAGNAVFALTALSAGILLLILGSRLASLVAATAAVLVLVAANAPGVYLARSPVATVPPVILLVPQLVVLGVVLHGTLSEKSPHA